jgi:hypothetical protein
MTSTGPGLSQSIRSTLEQSGTQLPKILPVALSGEFCLAVMKKAQWDAFCTRLGLKNAPALDAIGSLLFSFLMPAVEKGYDDENLIA